jgi:hypothetical protein
LEELVWHENIIVDELDCLVQTPRGRLHLRSGLKVVSNVLELLDDEETLEAGLRLVIELCQDCDAALELGLRGLHPVLARLTRSCNGDSLELVYEAVQAAAAGLPPGHTFPMEQELDGHLPPPPLDVQHLDWKCLSKIRDKYDIIIGSDIVCSVEDGEAVAGAVASLLSPTGLAYMLIPPTRVRWGVEVLKTTASILGLSDSIEKVDREDVKAVEEEGDEKEDDVTIGGGYEDMLELHILSWNK